MRLAESMPDEQFVMICNSSEHDKGIHSQLIDQSRHLSNLEFIEFVSHTEIRPYYARAKLLVNTSEIEGFPNTFIEAAIEKTPVVSLNVNPNGMFTAHSIDTPGFGGALSLSYSEDY